MAGHLKVFSKSIESVPSPWFALVVILVTKRQRKFFCLFGRLGDVLPS